MAALDILIVETDDLTVLGIMDNSDYTGIPGVITTPQIAITAPAATTAITLPFTPNALNLFNNVNMHIDVVKTPLPDGLYQVTYSITNGNNLYASKCFYRTETLQARVDEAFMKIGLSTTGRIASQDLKLFQDCYIYLQGCKAAAQSCSCSLADQLYQLALDSINQYTNNQCQC